jgi:hypothetical protein
MPNSSIIGKAKNKIVKEFIKKQEIVNGIDSTKINKRQSEKLIGTHIFNYHQNPNTLDETGTFICVCVQVPDTFFRSEPYVKPNVEVYIYSHEKHMKVENIPKVTQNRNDYLSEQIDLLLNGRTDFGIGQLKLIQNTEGAVADKYLYRKLVFEALDLGNSLCEEID